MAKLRSLISPLLLVVTLVHASPAARAQDRTPALREEVRRLELELELLKRAVPGSFSEDEARAAIVKRASPEVELRFDRFSATERERTFDGRPSPLNIVRVELSARDSFSDIAFFLIRLGYARFPIEIEQMRFTAADAQTVHFTARLALRHFAPSSEPASPTFDRDMTASLQRRREELQERVEHMTPVVVRNNVARIAASLSTFMKAAEPYPIGLRRLEIDRGVTMEGIVIGANARRELLAALSTASINVQSREMKNELCSPFKLTAQVPPPEMDNALLAEGKEPDIVTGNSLFMSPLEEGCASAVRAAPRQVNVTGKDPAGVTMKLPNVSLADAFYVIADTTGESFILDHDVTGRVTMNVQRASVEQIISAIEEAVGISVGPPPLHRVSRMKTSLEERSYAGDPVTLTLQKADLLEVLCLFTEITALPIDVPEGLRGDLTIYAKEVEWDRSLEAIVNAHQLSYTIEQGKMLIRRASDKTSVKLTEACEVAHAAPLERLSSLTVEQLETADIELAGIVQERGGQWYGYSLLPPGRLHRLDAKRQLRDATIVEVDATGVRLSTDKRLTLSMTP